MNDRVSRLILDSSAVLAVLNHEPGADSIAEALASPPPGGIFMHAINAFEVANVLVRDNHVPLENACEMAVLDNVTLILDIHRDSWSRAVAINANCKRLSLADCFCIAAAEHLDADILTGDRSFQDADSSIQMLLFR